MYATICYSKVKQSSTLHFWHWNCQLLLFSFKNSVLPERDGNWEGVGKAILGTERVNTSAGDWTDGVSSAGGVKSISSSKLSSNSWKKKSQ